MGMYVCVYLFIVQTFDFKLTDDDGDENDVFSNIYVYRNGEMR